MSIKVVKWDAKKDGPVSAESMGRKLRMKGYQFLQHTYEVGTVLQEHAHAEPRKDAVISGELKVSMFGSEMVLKAGDVLDVPIGVEHTAAVIGGSPVVILEAALTDIPVEHWNPERDGQLSVDNMARKLASYGFTYRQQVYGPGSILCDHAHREPTRDAVVSGQLVVTMFGKEAELGPGDMVEIPTGVEHGVRVISSEPCVTFESAVVELNIDHWKAKVDGPLTTENIAKKLKTMGYHCTEQHYAPGTVFHEHSHENPTKDAVVSGQFKVNMQDKEAILVPGDILDIPANIDHHAAVIGDQPVVVLEGEKGRIHRILWNEAIDGQLNADTLAHKLRSRGYEPSPSVLAPGTLHTEHLHDEQRMDAVLSGSVKVRMFGQESIMNAGDILEIPVGVEHTHEVMGNEPASIFEGIIGVLMVDAWNPAVDGVLNEENMGRKLKARGYHYKRNTYAPGTVSHDHAHEEHRKEAILSGQLKFSMIGKEVILQAGDMICVPIGIDHNTAVVGPAPVVALDAVKGDVRVDRWDTSAGGALSTDTVVALLQSRGYRCMVEQYNAGTVMHEHAHDEPRKDAVIAGRLKVTIFGKEVVLQPGDIITVPEGIDHEAVVISNEPVVLVEAAK